MTLAVPVHLAFLPAAKDFVEEMPNGGRFPRNRSKAGDLGDRFRLKDRWARVHSPGTSPKAAHVAELGRNLFLGLLDRVLLHDIITIVHGPLDPIFRAIMEPNLCLVWLFPGLGDFGPGERHFLLKGRIHGLRKENVKMRSTTVLELKNPEIKAPRAAATIRLEPGVEMAFTLFTIGRILLGIRQAKLRLDQITGIAANMVKVGAGLIGKLKDGGPRRWRGFRRRRGGKVPADIDVIPEHLIAPGRRQREEAARGQVGWVTFGARNKRGKRAPRPPAAGRFRAPLSAIEEPLLTMQTFFLYLLDEEKGFRAVRR